MEVTMEELLATIGSKEVQILTLQREIQRLKSTIEEMEKKDNKKSPKE